MKEYLPYISVIIAISGMIFAAGRRDKGYESELVILRARVNDLRDNTVKRIHERIEALKSDLTQCVTHTNLDALKELNTTRFDKIEISLKELSDEIKTMCRQIVKLETNLCHMDKEKNGKKN